MSRKESPLHQMQAHVIARLPLRPALQTLLPSPPMALRKRPRPTLRAYPTICDNPYSETLFFYHPHL
jgi:hypothetical protein